MKILSDTYLWIRKLPLNFGSHLDMDGPEAVQIFYSFLPRDAMRKRGLFCCPVSVCPPVRHVHPLYPHV